MAIHPNHNIRKYNILYKLQYTHIGLMQRS